MCMFPDLEVGEGVEGEDYGRDDDEHDGYDGHHLQENNILQDIYICIYSTEL